MDGISKQGGQLQGTRQPYDVSNRPSHWHQRKPTGNVGFVRELCYHTLDDAKVPIDHTI